MSITKLKNELKKNNSDLALFYNLDSEIYNKNIIYFTGYKGLGLLCVPKTKPAFLLVPLMEFERAKKSTKVKVYVWKKGKRLFEACKQILVKNNINHKTISLIKDDTSLSAFKSLKSYIKKIKIKDISTECLNLRKIKTEQEIILLRKSANITSKIIKNCIKNFHRFKTEKEVEIFLHTETIKHGCTLAFPSIVASGKTGSMPHSEPRNKKLEKGFCVIDFGVNYKGYHSDITRTIYLGNSSKKEVEKYNLLLKTQKELIKKVKLNKKCSDLYNDSLDLLRNDSDYFTHGLGHGIGLQIHELPNLKPLSDEVIKNNMVFTIEPGLYFENKFGIRIEDDILVKNGKPEVLTKVPKNLIIIRRKK